MPIRISSLGYVFFGQDASLFALPLDERTLAPSGDAVKLLDDLPITQLGRMPFSASAGEPPL